MPVLRVRCEPWGRNARVWLPGYREPRRGQCGDRAPVEPTPAADPRGRDQRGARCARCTGLLGGLLAGGCARIR